MYNIWSALAYIIVLSLSSDIPYMYALAFLTACKSSFPVSGLHWLNLDLYLPLALPSFSQMSLRSSIICQIS